MAEFFSTRAAYRPQIRELWLLKGRVLRFGRIFSPAYRSGQIMPVLFAITTGSFQNFFPENLPFIRALEFLIGFAPRYPVWFWIIE